MNRQSGFTLVELAIVLMIIGLLIGGILKGQELIENARTISAVRQIQSYKTGTLVFRDSYGSWPGDIINPNARIPNCTSSPCADSGNGNGRLEFDGDIEILNYWRHLSLTNLISGIDVEQTNGMDLYPKLSLSGGNATIAAYDNYAYLSLSAGNIFFIDNEGADAFTGLTSKQAARIDAKADDGRPRTGDYVTQCQTNLTAGNVYTETNNKECALLTEID